MTASGDRLIPLRAADGKSTAFKLNPADTSGDRFIPVMAADGKAAAMKVTPVTSSGDQGFPVMAADGKVALMKSGSVTCLIDRLRLNYHSSSIAIDSGTRVDTGKITSGDYMRWDLASPLVLPENTYVLEVPKFRIDATVAGDSGFGAITNLSWYFSFELLGLGVTVNSATVSMAVPAGSRHLTAFFWSPRNGDAGGISFVTGGGTLTGVKKTLHLTMPNSMRDKSGATYTGAESSITLTNQITTAQGSRDVSIGSMYITEPELPCYKTTETDVSFDETDDFTIIAGWSFYLLKKSPLLFLKGGMVCIGDGSANLGSIDLVAPGSNRFHTSFDPGYWLFYTGADTSWTVTYPSIPFSYSQYANVDDNYDISSVKLELNTQGQPYPTLISADYNSTYMYRRKP